MTSLFKKILLVLSTTFLLGASCQNPVPVDGKSLTISNGNNYYWDLYLLPLQIHIDSSLPFEIKQIVKQAAKTWEDKVGWDLFDVSEVDPLSREILGFPVAGVISVSRSQLGTTESNATINGLAEIFLYRNSLGGDQGRIYGVNMWIDIDLSINKMFAVVLHEFGHCLTLDHDGDKSSIMFPHATADPNAEIKQEDILRIRTKAFW